ncbi:Fe(3+) dicitrate ABC transporter substrate-binding protein [Vibrio sp. WJH972]
MKKFKSPAFLNLWPLVLTLCIASARAENRVVKHELGDLTLEKTPTRIVVLEYSFIDALAAIRISPVGIADDKQENRVISQVKALIQPWTSVGLRSQPNLEVIAGLKPDLIIADLHRHKISYGDLSKIAPTMLLKSRGETYQDSLDSALLIGIAVDKEKEMRARIERHKKRIQEYKSKFKDVGSVQFATVNDRGMWMHGPLSFTGSLIEHLGLKTAIPNLQDSHILQANLELFLQANPDWLFYTKKKSVTLWDSWQQNPLFNLLKISKTKQAYPVSSELWSLNRGMLAAEEIAAELEHYLISDHQQ